MALLASSAPLRANEELTRREKGDLAIRARAIFKKHCFECHGGAESHGTIAVLDHARLIATGPNPVPFVAPGKVAASQVIQFLEEGSMPPGDRPRPTPDEIQTLKDWIEATAPSYPAAFDDRTTLRTIQTDLKQHPDDAPSLRYFSLAHLIRDDGELADLKRAEFNLQKSLTWCGVKPPAGQPAAVPVDGTATLFRFDVRHAGWDNRELFFRSPKWGVGGLEPITPYDLILLEYPYAQTIPPGDALAGDLHNYTVAARLVRPVPFLRADWLGEQLAVKAPLADDLRSLGELATALKKQNAPELGKERQMPCGPATRAFAAKNPVPATPKAGTTRPILPLSAWYSGDCQADPAPFSLSVAAIGRDGKPIQEVGVSEPFELTVKTDRPIHFVLLMVWSNGEVAIQGTKQGGFLEAGEHKLNPIEPDGTSRGAFRITGILTGEPKANEYFVLLASTEKITPPVIVLSRHNDGPDCRDTKRYPIYRFIPDPGATFDPTRVVRRVVAITVHEK